jgi:two-component system chemotaxis response regulator CheB
MGSSIRVLIAEDETKSFEILKRVLKKNNWVVDSALNGEDALKMLKESTYQILLTDINMPKMNGMELIGRVRNEVTPKPLIIVFTGYRTAEIKNRALELEIDGFFTKPVDFKELFACIFEGLERAKKNKEKPPSLNDIQASKDPDLIHPPFVGVMIAVSTGGPQTLRKFFDNLTPPFHSSLFMVQHSPAWALESLAQSLDKEYEFKVQLAANEMMPQADHVYLAPGDTHLCINPENYCLELTHDPKEHFLRPAADPLFRSATRAFGKYCVGMVLSGLGNDGAAGAKIISESGGTILIQDPKTAVARFMPQAAIDSGVKHQMVPLEKMAEILLKNTLNLSQRLNGHKRPN